MKSVLPALVAALAAMAPLPSMAAPMIIAGPMVVSNRTHVDDASLFVHPGLRLPKDVDLEIVIKGQHPNHVVRTEGGLIHVGEPFDGHELAERLNIIHPITKKEGGVLKEMGKSLMKKMCIIEWFCLGDWKDYPYMYANDDHIEHPI